MPASGLVYHDRTIRTINQKIGGTAMTNIAGPNEPAPAASTSVAAKLRGREAPSTIETMASPQRSKRRKSLSERARQRELSQEERDELAKKMCREKKRFALQSEAKFAAEDHGLSVYRCPVCGGWHLTSKS